MMNRCRICGSYAINHHMHDRDGSDPDLCDVHYWKTRAVMPDLERRAKEWHERVFGEVDILKTSEKLEEEYDELSFELGDVKDFGFTPSDPIHKHHILQEAGDVLMVLSHIIRHYGGTVEGCWRAAIEKCERREKTGER